MSVIKTDLVSCIIPTYKRSDTLKRAIISVLNQTYQFVEVLIVDDNEVGSLESDYVKDIVDSYSDKRVQLVTQPKHINGAEARNAGIRASKGEYIAFLDDDDEWLPEKIGKQITFLKEHENLKGCSVLYNEYKGDTVVHSCPVYTADNLFQKIFRREVAVFTSTVLLRRDCLIESGMFDVRLKRHQDLQMLLRFTNNYEMGVIPEYLVKLHLDSGINRPNADAIIKVKKDFFNSVADLYEGCAKRERKLIKSAHCYEVMFAALKQKKILMGAKYFIKAGLDMSVFKLLQKRIKDRKFVAK